MAAIPPRQPVGDPFSGALVRVGDTHALSPTPVDGGETIAHGVVVRYGARLLEKPLVGIVPGLIALERGEMMTGEAAWEFLYKRSMLFPRAEVYGYRDDGTDAMLTVKWLDLAIPPMVLAYADADATTPLAEVKALIGPPDAFPARTLEHLPIYGAADELNR